MNRRELITTLACLPFLGFLKPKDQIIDEHFVDSGVNIVAYDKATAKTVAEPFDDGHLLLKAVNIIRENSPVRLHCSMATWQRMLDSRCRIEGMGQHFQMTNAGPCWMIVSDGAATEVRRDDQVPYAQFWYDINFSYDGYQDGQTLPLMQGVKDSTKPSEIEIDWVRFG